MAVRTRPLPRLARRSLRNRNENRRPKLHCGKTPMARAIRVALCVGLIAAPMTVTTRAVAGAAADYGDAPAPFRTLDADFGPAHVPTGPQLGSLRDSESDGVPSASADGDDLAGSDDEDGVTLQPSVVGSADGAVTVNVQGGPGQLDAWIDFNGDGSWGGSAEHVLINRTLADGDNSLGFSVPADALSTPVVARFRISSAGGLGQGLLSADGEVEDHLLTFSAPTASSGTLVDSGQALGSALTRELALVDVDGDGDLDLIDVEGREYTTGLVDRIYLNDGNGNFSDSGQLLSTLGTYGLAVGDIDGDGDIDLMTPNIDTGDSIRLYRNDGLGNFSLDGTFSISGFIAFELELLDLDGDGDLDLYAGNQVSNRVYLNDGSGAFTDTGQLLGTGVITLGLSSGDIDGDGDIDIFESSVNGDANRPWFNDGSGFFSAGTSLGSERSWDSALGDFDGDGDLDLAEGRVSGVYVWLNDGAGNFSGETQLSSNDVDSIALADMNGDGNLDLIEGVDGGGNRIYLGDGAGNFVDSGQTLGSESTQALAIGDVDGDGTLDLVDGVDGAANRVWINGEFDFGDADAPYPTLISAGGARHTPSGPTLGTLRDSEADGLPTASADGDDLDGIDDEDGVTLIAAPIGTAMGALTVNLQNGPAQLDAWIDFNGDGSWGGPYEHVVIDQAIANGDTGVPFQIPGDAISGNVAARFRISSAGDHAQGGAASDGEVEDHLLTLAAPTASLALLADSGQAIGNQRNIRIHMADVDGDGDLDLATSENGYSGANGNRLYLNDGSGIFSDSGQSVGGSSYAIVSGDIDGDGDIDLVNGRGSSSNSVEFYLNDGSGNFSLNAAATISGFTVGGVVLADLDADGDLDLFTGGLNRPNRVFLNDGSGLFSDTGQLLDNAQTLGVIGADIDGDGDIDVFDISGAGDGAGNQNRFWINDGAGSFSAGPNLGNNRGWDVALGDVDGDGDIDLIEGRTNGSFLRLNDGSGNFGGASRLSSIEVYAVELADMDGDGDLDLVEGNYSGGDRLLLNDGAGNFTDSGQDLGSDATSGLVVGDVDGDGDLDVATANYGGANRVWINSAVDFGDADAPYPTLLADGGALHVSTGPTLGALRDGELDGQPTAGADGDDLDGIDDEDGVTLIAAPIGTAMGALTVNLQNGPAQLDAWIDFNGDGSWGGPYEHVVIDQAIANGDNGVPFQIPGDAISGNVAARFRVSSAGGHGQGGGASDGEVEDHQLTLSAPTASVAQLADSGQELGNQRNIRIHMADVDGDGDLDLATAENGYSGANGNRLYLNDGLGNFSNSGQSVGGSTYAIVSGDVDGDGDVDLVMGNGSSSRSVEFFLNDGSGNFSLNAAATISGFTVGGVVLADLDADGDLDVFTGGLNRPNRVFLNDGAGNFADTGQLLADAQTLGVIGADIDSDGDIDVFDISGTGDGAGNENRFWINDGAGNFSAGPNLGNNRGWDVSLGDVDGDGDIDLIEGRTNGSFLRLNDGSGNFGGTTRLSSIEVYAVELADMDGDGDLDLLEGNYSGGDRLLLNDGAGNFTDSGQDLGSDVTHGLVVGDVDGDGDLDVATANYAGPNRVWINRAPQVQLSVSSSSGSEAAGSVITVTATAEGAVNGDQTVDLAVSGSGITASDFVLGTTQLTIANGMTDASTSFTVLDDALNEGDEMAQVSISAVSSGLIVGTPDSQTITIVDDDPLPAVSGLNFSTGSFAETGGAITLNLSLNRASAFDQCYTVSFAGGATLNSDYSVSDDDAAAGIQACASAGSTSAQLTVTPIDDAVFEGGESITAMAGALSAGTLLTDDEDTPAITALVFDPDSVSENGGVSQLMLTQSNPATTAQCYTVALSGSADFAVDFTIADDDGAAGLQLCVAAGETVRSVPATGIDDAVFEGDETVQADSGGFSATLTLLEDKTPPSVQTLSFDAASLAETDPDIGLLVTLNRLSDFESCQTINFAGTAGFGIDYAVSDDDPLTAGIQACVEAGAIDTDLVLTPIDDAVFEGDESIDASSGSGAASATLTDAEDTPAVTALVFDPDSVSENGGVSQLMLTQSNQATTARCYNVALSGSADFGVDYTITDDDGAAGLQLCVAAGETVRSVPATGIDDAVFEGDENVQADSGGFSAMLTLLEDKTPPSIQSLSFDLASFAETDPGASLLVTLNRLSTEESCQTIAFAGTATLAVDYTVSDDDPVAAGIQACIEAGSIDTDLSLSPIDDNVFEGDESINASDAGRGGATTASVTLTDAEDTPTLTALSLAPTAISENGGSSTLTATQSNPATTERCYDVQSSGSASFDEDYVLADDDAAPGTQVCVPSSSTSGTLPLLGVDDPFFEGDETADLSADGLNTSVTIVDDEMEPELRNLSFDRAAFPEQGGEALLSLEVSHPWQAPTCIDVLYSGTATLDLDYASEDQSGDAGIQLCLPGESLRGDLLLMGIDDALVEDKEVIEARVDMPNEFTATVLIGDDESNTPLFADGFEAPLPPEGEE